MDVNNYTLYALIFPDNKMYFGITKQNVNQRWSNGKGYKAQTKVFDAINHYGWDNIHHKIIKKDLSKKEAMRLEKKLIKKYNTIQNGYNASKGGEGGGKEWKEIKYENKIYSPSELEKKAKDGITAHDITTRIGRGWDVKRALNQPKITKQYKRKYKGEYFSVSELYAMRKCNITRKQLISRLSRGWSIERALSQPVGKKNQPYFKKYQYNNKWYNISELLQFSKVKGLTETLLRDRLNRKWSVEKALTKPLKTRDKLLEYQGVEYTTKEIAKLSPYDITHHHVTDRLNAGWDIEKIINTPIHKKK